MPIHRNETQPGVPSRRHCLEVLAPVARKNRERIAGFEATEAEALHESEEATHKLDELITQCELAQRKVEQANESLSELKTAVQAHRTEVEQADGALHKLQVRQRELEVKIDSVRQRGHEQLDLDVTEVYERVLQGVTDEDEPCDANARTYLDVQFAVERIPEGVILSYTSSRDDLVELLQVMLLNGHDLPL